MRNIHDLQIFIDGMIAGIATSSEMFSPQDVERVLSLIKDKLSSLSSQQGVSKKGNTDSTEEFLDQLRKMGKDKTSPTPNPYPFRPYPSHPEPWYDPTIPYDPNRIICEVNFSNSGDNNGS